MSALAVFFDLDGVLCDFVRGALAAHGRADVPEASVAWGIEAQLGIEPAAFWGRLGFDFWAGLEPYADGFALLRRAEELVGPERIGLLTSPCDTAGCVDGKRAWVARHLPDYARRLFVGSAKELFAGPSKVLVDDHDANVDRFLAAGGFTFQPPRPWNRLAVGCCKGTAAFNVELAAKTLEMTIGFARGWAEFDRPVAESAGAA